VGFDDVPTWLVWLLIAIALPLGLYLGGQRDELSPWIETGLIVGFLGLVIASTQPVDPRILSGATIYLAVLLILGAWQVNFRPRSKDGDSNDDVRE
jgi:hypothetical protein